MEVNSTCRPKFEESLRVEHFTDGKIGNKDYIRTKLILGKDDLSRWLSLISIVLS